MPKQEQKKSEKDKKKEKHIHPDFTENPDDRENLILNDEDEESGSPREESA